MDEKESVKSQEVMLRLPEEIVVLVTLTRVPLKSLLRFKSVSKGWNSTISSLQFAESHRLRSTNNPLGGSRYKLLVSSTTDLNFLGLGGNNSGSDGLVSIENLIPENLRDFFLGSSRGLVFSLFDDYKIVAMQFSRDGSKLLMFVYSLKSGLWNKLKVVRDAKYLMVFKTGQLANDALHWLLFQGCMHEMQCILHFNLVDETINEMPLPNREFN